jgi:membrane glycosyltransferase
MWYLNHKGVTSNRIQLQLFYRGRRADEERKQGNIYNYVVVLTVSVLAS